MTNGIGDFVASIKEQRQLVTQVIAAFKGEAEGHPFRGNQWSGGASGGADMPEVRSYEMGGDRGTTPAPNGEASSWTPSKGGMLFHGTGANFTKFNSSEAYLTDDFSEAEGYAKGVHLGGSPSKHLRVATVMAKPGKTLDINGRIEDAISNDDDIDEAISKAAQDARKQGARYVIYDHPSNVSGDRDQRVVVSLHPQSDLKLTGGWKVN